MFRCLACIVYKIAKSKYSKFDTVSVTQQTGLRCVFNASLLQPKLVDTFFLNISRRTPTVDTAIDCAYVRLV